MVNSVVVTGASTGLGLETALYLAERDFKVYATMRDLGRREALDQEAMRRKVRLDVLQLDITNPDSIQKAFHTVVQQSGGLYGLINNAGIGLRGYFEDLSDEEIRKVFEVNIYGTMAVTRAALPYMRSAGRGRIVMITSVGGRIGAIGVSAYCSTKFAQEGFGESLSQEVAPLGIQVVLVEPAIIKTERWGMNRAVAKRAFGPDSPYTPWFRESERLADRLVETSPTKPIHVAKTVYKALKAKHPRLRYLVGWRASVPVALRRHIPGELFDRIFFREAVRRVIRPTLKTDKS